MQLEAYASAVSYMNNYVITPDVCEDLFGKSGFF